MEARFLIRKLTESEPLNPYQISGISAVIEGSEMRISPDTSLTLENTADVLLILDRSGAEASVYLLEAYAQNSLIKIRQRFSRESIDELKFLTSYEGRQANIAELLIPALYELPNWMDPVKLLSHYIMDRDEDSARPYLASILNVISGYLFAAAKQPFDAEAAGEAEYTLLKFVENIFRTCSESELNGYLKALRAIFHFLTQETLPQTLNSFERRIISLKGIRSALAQRSKSERNEFSGEVNAVAAGIIYTALSEIQACPEVLINRFESTLPLINAADVDQFQAEILFKIKSYSTEEIKNRRSELITAQNNLHPLGDEDLDGQVSFITGLSTLWKDVFKSFESMADRLPSAVQEVFAEILALQILAVDKPDVKELLIEGLCNLVIGLEQTRKKTSKKLVRQFGQLFLNRIYNSGALKEVLSSLRAIEALGVALGRAGYSLMEEELIGMLVKRPIVAPREAKFTVEDDDTGEPLVLAEETGINTAHVRHIKAIMSIIASNPRITHELIPYLIIQVEIGKTRISDEDLIQYWISSLLRANCSITHFLIRTLVKAIPYSLKDIGPLDTLRLTAAGLAKLLANRGVKPIGNFLGKLRGDIHWRGSIENFYFCVGILRYLLDGRPEHLIEWMPPESAPYLKMDQWLQPEEKAEIQEFLREICGSGNINLFEKNGAMAIVGLDTSKFEKSEHYSDFSKRIVLDMISLIKGLYEKYFVLAGSDTGADVGADLDSLNEIILRRSDLKTILTPDIREAMPPAITLTEGLDNNATNIKELQKEKDGAPIILRSKKTGHAYAQKATYIEQRFEAFTKDLALESEQETLATTINNTRFDVVTSENLSTALVFMDHLVRGVCVNGHSSYYLQQAGRDLRRSAPLGLTYDKVRDIIAIVKKELDDIHVAYRNWFEGHFDVFLACNPMDKLPRKLKDLTTLRETPETDFFKNYLKTLYLSDLQARDGNLRVLETFIDKVELFFNQRLADSGKRVAKKPKHSRRVPFYFPDKEEISPCRIGLKASLLRFAEITPPYFVITTDQTVCTQQEMLTDTEFKEGLAASLEKLGKAWGKSLGDPDNPALFSVRSGARISMPGMMITITNVGINDEIAEGLAKRYGVWFAYDCYRRFLQEFSQSVFNVQRDQFQEIIDDKKAELKITRKAHMSASQMKSLAFEYKKLVEEHAPQAIGMLDNGRFLDILSHCAAVVLNSYDGHAAKKYREAAGIHGNWRTPVIVQGMVYGNMAPATSGTGVISYNPFTLDLRGDFAQGDQGTDVVDGKVPTIPVYDIWKTKECLASKMPAAWKRLSSILFRTAEFLHFDTRLEYTIENDKVYILQIRKDREKRDRTPSLVSAGYTVIATGAGVSGKIFRGIMVTDRNQIAPFRHITKAQSIIDAMNENLSEHEKLDGFIFVVNDPIPEEIMEEIFSLPVATALISRQGGRGAHAADIAKALGKTYIGQVSQIVKFTGRPESVGFNDKNVIVGSKMIIHGQTGEIALYAKTGEKPCWTP